MHLFRYQCPLSRGGCRCMQLEIACPRFTKFYCKYIIVEDIKIACLRQILVMQYELTTLINSCYIYDKLYSADRYLLVPSNPINILILSVLLLANLKIITDISTCLDFNKILRYTFVFFRQMMTQTQETLVNEHSFSQYYFVY